MFFTTTYRAPAARSRRRNSVIFATLRPAEVGDVDVGEPLQPLGERLDRGLPFGLAHRYTAVSSRTPGPIVLDTVAERR